MDVRVGLRGVSLRLADDANELQVELRGLRLADHLDHQALRVERLRLRFASFSATPSRVEILRSDVDLPLLGSLLRRPGPIGAASSPTTTATTTSKPIRRAPPATSYRVIDGGVLVEGTRLRVDDSLEFVGVSFALRPGPRAGAVLLEGLRFTCQLNRPAVPRPIVVGPLAGKLTFEPDGGGHLAVEGGAPRAQGEAEVPQVSLQGRMAPDGTVTVDGFSCGLPVGGRVLVSGSLAVGRTPPLRIQVELRDVHADRLPVRSDLLGNLTRGTVNLTGTWEGGLLFGDERASCHFSVDAPRFMVLRGEDELPLDLEHLEADLLLEGRRLSLTDLDVRGLGGTVAGTAAVDFASTEGVGWETALRYADVQLPRVAPYLGLTGIRRGQARGEVELRGGGGVPYRIQEHGVAGHVIVERLDLDYEDPERNLTAELTGARLEIEHRPFDRSRGFLRCGHLTMSGLRLPVDIPEISAAVTVTTTGTVVEFLRARVGRDGTVTVRRTELPLDPNETATVAVELRGLEAAFLDYLSLGLPPVPPGRLDATVQARGSLRRPQDATVHAELRYDGAGDAPPLKLLEGRFSIQDGAVALEGARALALGGFVEAAGRGGFVGAEPVGRGRVVARGLNPAGLSLPPGPWPDRVDADLSLDRTDATTAPFALLSLTATGATSGVLRAALRPRSLFSGRHRLEDSAATVTELTLTTREQGALTLVPGASLRYHDGGYEVHLPGLEARTAAGRTFDATNVTLDGRLLQRGRTVELQPLILASAGVSVVASGVVDATDAPRAALDLRSEGLTLPTSPPLPICAQGHLDVTTTEVTVDDGLVTLDQGRVTFRGRSPMPPRVGPWSLEGTTELTDPLALWRLALGPGAPPPLGPVDATLVVTGPGPLPLGNPPGTWLAGVVFRPLRLGLDSSGERFLSLTALQAHGGPRGSAGPGLNLNVGARSVTYQGPELRRVVSLDDIHLEGSLGASILSLTTGRFDVAGGGRVDVTGSIPLGPDLDGDLAFELHDLDLSVWEPTHVVDLDRGRVDASGTFLGAWNDLEGSVIEVDVALHDAAIAAAGLSPGPVDDFTATIAYERGGLRVADVSAHLLGGVVTGSGGGSWGGSTRSVDLSLDLQDLDLARLMAANATPETTPPGLNGRLRGNLTLSARDDLRNGLGGSGSVTVDELILRDAGTTLAETGRRLANRDDDLIFTRADSRVIILGDTLTLRDLNLRAGFGSMEGWLRLRRRTGEVEGRLWSNLNKGIIPSAFLRGLASLVGGRYLTVGLTIDGILGDPKVSFDRSPGSRESFLAGN